MKGIWLNFSGGGHRAAIYHFGALQRLHEARLTGHIVGISATSGGALTAAMWVDSGFSFGDDPDARWRNFHTRAMAIFQRGLVGPAALLVAAYYCYASCGLLWILSILGWASWAPTCAEWTLACVFTIGLSLHLSEVIVLLADGALTANGWSNYTQEFRDIGPAKKSRTFVRALLSPSRARWLTLNLRAFRGRQAFVINRAQERVYFNVVNLEKGQQAVVDPSGIYHLDEDTSEVRDIWEHRWYRGWRFSKETLLASLVAASSAFPPLFRPVPIEASHGDRGITERFHLWDGGVTDNAGFKLARRLVISSRQAKQAFGTPSFEDRTAVVVTMDASMPVSTMDGVSSRLRGLRRLVAVAQNAQSVDMFAAQDWYTDIGLRAGICGLRVGYIGRQDDLDEVSDILPQVRTHLDAFTIAEIGALAYCGYNHVDWALRNDVFQGIGPEDVESAKLTSLDHYLADLGGSDMSRADLRRQLDRSMSRVSVRRWLRAARDRRATARRKVSPRPFRATKANGRPTCPPSDAGGR